MVFNWFMENKMKKNLLRVAFLVLIISQAIPIMAQDAIPRSEYPRPQFQRSDWINLNGKWTYSFDFGLSGRDRKLQESHGFRDEIIVPFCPESKLSGVEYKDFILGMWYHRIISIPKNWADRKVLIHFEGADYESEIFIDGQLDVFRSRILV